MTTVIESIIKAKFLATETQVESLASIVVEGISASGTYLSVLIAHTQDALKNRRKPSKETQLTAINDVHKRFYGHVLRGVGPPEIADKERNRRSIFARTTASDLRHYVKAGGDLRGLDAAAVSKAKLRAEGRPVPAGTRAERGMKKTHDAIFRALERLARQNVDAAREQIIEMQTELEGLLAKIGRPPQMATRKAVKRAERHRAAAPAPAAH